MTEEQLFVRLWNILFSENLETHFLLCQTFQVESDNI